MANIVLNGVNKVYPNNVHAVFDFNLEIKDKEFIVFVGPSGCGKSTTLRMIAGLEEITSGEFFIDGKLMNYVPPKDRNVSMVFQNYALYPHMTVYRNMAYGLSIKRDDFPIYEADAHIDELLKVIKLNKRKMNDTLKLMAKDADNEQYKADYAVIYKTILDSLTEIMEIRKPIIGCDERRIKKLTKEIAFIEKEINYVSGLIDNEIKENTGDEELIKLYKDDVSNYEGLLVEKQKELEEVQLGNSSILKNRKMYEYEIDYEVFHAAEILDLQPYLSRFPSALSGGQRQRVALGRAIVRRPKVFLMDEPLSNLDAKLRVQTRGEISKLHKRVNATTIYVTHDQTEAMTLADRIVIMKDGRVQQIAKPMDAFNDPANIFVAGFIGSPSMNFINGKVVNGQFVSDNELIKFAIPETNKIVSDNYEGKEITLGIRPENISIDGISSKCNVSFALHVDSVELLGDEFIIYTNTQGQAITIKTDKPVDPKVDSVSAYFNLEKLYFFDKETTLRIK